MYKLFEPGEVDVTAYKVSAKANAISDGLREFDFSFSGLHSAERFKLTTEGKTKLEQDANIVPSQQDTWEDEIPQERADRLPNLTPKLSNQLRALYKKVKGTSSNTDEIKEDITLTSEEFRLYFERAEGPTPAKWRHVAGDIAWGNAAWMLGDSFGHAIPHIYSTQAFSGVSYATLFWPLAIGVIVLAKYYRDAVKNIEREYHRPPTAAELSKINTDTFVLGCKVFGAVAGAELGKILALQVVNWIGQAVISANGLINPLGHLIMAGIVGLCAGLLVAGITLIREYTKNETKSHKDIWADAGKLFLATTLAGAAWYGISIIPGLGSVILGTDGNTIGKGVLDIVTSVAKSIITYLAIKFTFFDLYKATKPTETEDQTYSWRGEKTPYNYMLSANFSCFSSKETEGSKIGYDHQEKDFSSSSGSNLAGKPFSPRCDF